MASLGLAFAAPAAASGRMMQATAATKSASGGAGEKGLFDWIIGGLQKEDQLVETDPILNKVEEKSGGGGGGNGTTSRRKSTTSVTVPASKKSSGGGGVFGGLFAKK